MSVSAHGLEDPTPASVRQSDPKTEPAGGGDYTFWRGRVALYAILKGLGVGTGDRVVVPGYTCFAVPSAVLFAGAHPVYVDIDPQTFSASLASIKAICPGRERPRAVLVQHTFGIPADTAPIAAWARERGIAVIEDCAQVFGSRYRDENGTWCEVGALGDAAFFSSHWSKPVSSGLGGWVRSTDPRLQEGLRRFHDRECAAPTLGETLLLAAQVGAREVFSSPRVYWMARSAYRWLSGRGVLVGSSNQEELRGVMPRDYAKRMSAFQQWLLKRRLGRLSLQRHRQKLKQIYDAALEKAGFPTLKVPGYADPVLACYPVRVRNKEGVLEEAQRRRIELGEWYRRPVDLPGSSETEVCGYRMGMCPEGERAAREVVNLPMHARISERAAREIVEFLKEVA